MFREFSTKQKIALAIPLVVAVVAFTILWFSDLSSSPTADDRIIEALIPEPDLLERYGVFSSRSSLRSIVRTGVRSVLFNRWTVPPLQRALASSGSPGRFAEWTYWKLMLHHTARGYRDEAPRSPQPTPTRPEPRLVDAS